MDMLERSSRANGFDFISLPERHRRARLHTIDKVRLLNAYLQTGALADADSIMFTDAYDVLVIQHASLTLDRFFDFQADIVVNAEANQFPEHQDLKKVFDVHPSRWRYLNSGCFIGYVWAVREMVSYISASIPEAGYDEHHMDQLLMQQFYAFEASRRKVRMCLDTRTSIFAPLMMTEEEFMLERYGVRNLSTGRRPCVLHANGDRANMNILWIINGLREHTRSYLATARVGTEVLRYSRTSRRMSLSMEDEVICILVSGDLASAFTTSVPYFTFRPEGVAHTDATTLREWEVLQVSGDRLFTAHGTPLDSYVDGLGSELVRLAAISFTQLKMSDPELILSAVQRVANGG